MSISAWYQANSQDLIDSTNFKQFSGVTIALACGITTIVLLIPMSVSYVSRNFLLLLIMNYRRHLTELIKKKYLKPHYELLLSVLLAAFFLVEGSLSAVAATLDALCLPLTLNGTTIRKLVCFPLWPTKVFAFLGFAVFILRQSTFDLIAISLISLTEFQWTLILLDRAGKGGRWSTPVNELFDYPSVIWELMTGPQSKSGEGEETKKSAQWEYV